MSRLSIDEIRELLQEGIDRKTEYLEATKDIADNPTVKPHHDHAKGEIEGMRAALEALNGDAWTLKFCAGKFRPQD